MKKLLVKNIKKIKDCPYQVIVIGGIVVCLGINSLSGLKKDSSKQLPEVISEQKIKILEINNNLVSDELKMSLENQEDILLKVKLEELSYVELYKTIDLIKELISDYCIQYPILYDIENYQKDISKTCLLAEEFCNKLSANGCYVGLYGQDTVMLQFETDFIKVTGSHAIDLYDKFITYDEENSYTGIYYMSQKKDEKIEFECDLASVIENNNLNNKAKFVSDYKYQVKEGDNLAQIALLAKMSLTDLAEYNNIDNPNQIYVGQKITFPNYYRNENLIDKNDNDYNKTRLVKGIDVSEYQGVIDWNEVKKHIDFAIIRLCDFYFVGDNGCKLDDQFIKNMQMCEQLNIPVGVYYFSRATNEEEAKKEALFVSENLKNYTLEYPVYMDIETDYQNELMANQPEKLKAIVIAAMNELESSGYYAGVYCNRGIENDSNRYKFVQEMSQKYSFWLTSNPTYDVKVDFSKFRAENNILYIPDDYIAMYQYSQNGTIAGIDSANVDLNYANASLSEEIVEHGFDRAKR